MFQRTIRACTSALAPQIQSTSKFAGRLAASRSTRTFLQIASSPCRKVHQRPGLKSSASPTKGFPGFLQNDRRDRLLANWESHVFDHRVFALNEPLLLYTGEFMAIKSKLPVGILGATGMVGQRFIQLLENHPWLEVAWLAASDRSSGKTYGEAAKWRLDSPLPERIAQMTVRQPEPFGAPKIIFASIDAAYARELEPKFAAAGCAVVSNSSAFRMAPNVPLVLPEVNADHLQMIEEQSWRKESGGYIVTNSNC